MKPPSILAQLAYFAFQILVGGFAVMMSIQVLRFHGFVLPAVGYADSVSLFALLYAVRGMLYPLIWFSR